MTRKNLLALAAACAALAVTLVGSDSAAQQQRARPDACIRDLAHSTLETLSWDDQSAQRSVAETCNTVAATARGVQAARARFYSGRAYNHIPGQTDEAIRQLEIAVNSGRDFERDFGRELRASRLELVQAYRAGNRLEAARNLLNSTALSPADPAVAYQRSMLILAELREAGRESAFEVLRNVFTQDDARLLGSPSDPTGLTRAEIQRGRSWLFWLGMSLGQEALAHPGRDDDTRRADALRAINYFGPVASAIAAACPDPQPVACGGIGGTEQIGSLGYPTTPSADKLLSASFQLGVAHLKAAGVQEPAGLAAIAGSGGVGEAGGLDCFSANAAPDAASHFQNARYAFETVTRRSPQGGNAAADAHWGLGCTILANIGTVNDPGEQQRQLAQAVEQLGQAPTRPLTLLTLARAQVLQGQMDTARGSYQRALQMAGSDTQCRPNQDPDPARRAELPSRIYLELARTRFSAPLSAGAPRGASDIFSRTIVEVAAARSQSLREAEGELKCAIALNYNNSEARLTLGHIYLRLGSEGIVDPPPFNKAAGVLRYFERPVGAGQEGRAEGLYLLSRRETMVQQNRMANGGSAYGNGSNAVGYATQAYNTTQRPEFRRQACVSQMLFGLTREEGYCAASGQGADRAESLLYEGMYWLRRGQNERDARMASWSRSIQSFNRGGAETSPGMVVESTNPAMPASLPLDDLMRYGERYVLRCARLDYGDRETASDDVRKFFRLSGMPDPCGGPAR